MRVPPNNLIARAKSRKRPPEAERQRRRTSDLDWDADSRTFVFDRSDANRARAAALQNYTKVHGHRLSEGKKIFIQAMAAVCLDAMSIEEASLSFFVRPTMLVAMLRRLPVLDTKDIYDRVTSWSNANLRAFDPSRHEALATARSRRPDKRGRVDASALPDAQQGRHRNPAPDPDGQHGLTPPKITTTSPRFGSAVAPSTHTTDDLDLEAFNGLFDPEEIAYFKTFERSVSAASPVTPVTAPSHDPDSVLMPPPGAIPKSRGKQVVGIALDRPIKRTRTRKKERPANTSNGEHASKGKAAQRPGEQVATEVSSLLLSPQDIAAVQREFLALAAVSVKRVHPQKLPLFHAMVDVCRGVDLNRAAASKLLMPEILHDALASLHTTSPIDVFVWLGQLSPDGMLTPPGPRANIKQASVGVAASAVYTIPKNTALSEVVYTLHPLSDKQAPQGLLSKRKPVGGEQL